MNSTDAQTDEIKDLCKQAVAEVKISREAITKLREYLKLADEHIARQEKLITSLEKTLEKAIKLVELQDKRQNRS